jgi:hypothetical protein
MATQHGVRKTENGWEHYRKTVQTPGIGQRASEAVERLRTGRFLGLNNPKQQVARRRARLKNPVPVRRSRRRRPRRGALFGVFSLVGATLIITSVALEVVSLTAAAEIGLAAEGLAFAASWWLGEPAPVKQGPVNKKGSKGKTLKQPTPKAPLPPGSHLCGEPCRDKTSCQRIVGPGNACPHHGRGSGNKGQKPTP